MKPVTYRLKKMGLAEAASAVEKEGIVLLPGRIRNGKGSREGIAIPERPARYVEPKEAEEFREEAPALMPPFYMDTQLEEAPMREKIGAPGSGKTTLLRDLTRQMADTMSVQAALIDERGELAACVDGVPQLDVGASTDVLDGLPKPESVPWLIRSMAPNVIAMDELSGAEDAACVMDAWACGASVLATVHGTALAETANRPALSPLFSRRCFDLYVLLSSEGGGKITALHDRCGSPIPLS
mgnify:CR=1 FL=1